MCHRLQKSLISPAQKKLSVKFNRESVFFVSIFCKKNIQNTHKKDRFSVKFVISNFLCGDHIRIRIYNDANMVRQCSHPQALVATATFSVEDTF